MEPFPMKDLADIVAVTLHIDKSHLAQLNREKSPEWDSFNHLLLISEIERELGVKFSVEEVAAIQTYTQLKEKVDAKLV